MMTFYFILGACMASFIMCLADRINRQISLQGFSQCDHCQQRLSSLALLPILGWLIFAGCCRHCGCKIAIYYPISEFCLALCFTLFSHEIDWLVLICLLLFLSCEDLYDRRAHAMILYPLIAVRLISNWQLETIMGLLTITLFSSFFIYYRKTMGSGDLPVLLVLYLMLPLTGFSAAILLASSLAIACCCLKKITVLPLIPFLSAAALITKLFVYSN